MVVHAYYPLGETRVEREALALIDHGYEVDVICLRGPTQPPIENENRVSIYRLPVRRHKYHGGTVQLLEYAVFFVLAFAKLASLHRRRRYAVVQIHNLPDFLVFAALVPKLTGARLILDLHDLMPEFYAVRFNSSLSSWPMRLIRWQERLSCKFADHVITVTEAWRKTLISRGVQAKKISVVMNVADGRIFSRAPAIERSIANDDCFRLIYHGNLSKRYGVNLAIRAVGLVRQHIPVHLTIHGSGPLLGELQELTADMGLEGNIRFSTRLVPTQELAMLIRDADAGIVPYQRDAFTDGILPTKLMEYVALGIPVIAARTSAITAYFDETMVEFFAPGDVDDLAFHILALQADREKRERLVCSSQQFLRRYSWSQISADYVALVDRLASKLAKRS
jgi:glycosyltransferase involved in cell wall biosynthesis